MAIGKAPDVTTWVALLRGVNVGRNQRVAMAELRALLGSLGHDDVRTYAQSGNAVFSTGDGGTGQRRADPGPQLERDIGAAIHSELGLEVGVVVRRAADVSAIVEANPFAVEGADPKELHVAFTSTAPPPATIDALDPADVEPDRVTLGDRVLSSPPNGVTGSRLPDWTKLLGSTVTPRNWNTVLRLRALAESGGGRPGT